MIRPEKITFMSCDPKDLIVPEVSMKDIWNFGQAPVEKAQCTPYILEQGFALSLWSTTLFLLIGPSVSLGLSKDQTSDRCTLTR